MHPQTSKETVDAAYHAMSTPWIGDCRLPTVEALDMLQFVVEHTDQGGNQPPDLGNQESCGTAGTPPGPFATYSVLRKAYFRGREKLAPHRF